MKAWLLLLCMLPAGLLPVFSQPAFPARRLHWNAQRGYAPFPHAASEAISIGNTTARPLTDSFRLPDSSSSFTLRFAAVNHHNHPAKSYPYSDIGGRGGKVRNPAWGFFVSNGCDSLIFRIKTEELHDAFSSESVLSVSVSSSDSKAATVTLRDGVDMHTGKNIWRLAIKDGVATLSGGNRAMRPVMSFPVSFAGINEIGFTSCPGASVDFSDITFSDESPEKSMVLTQWSNPDHLRNYLAATNDPLEGYWVLFDRTLEETLLQLGGDYRLAIVKAGEGYQLIYLDGARVCGGKWKPGMVKACLQPDPFPGIFSVEWIDPEGFPLSNSVKAQRDDGDTLVIQFPYQNSTIRLRKL